MIVNLETRKPSVPVPENPVLVHSGVVLLVLTLVAGFLGLFFSSQLAYVLCILLCVLAVVCLAAAVIVRACSVYKPVMEGNVTTVYLKDTVSMRRYDTKLAEKKKELNKFLYPFFQVSGSCRFTYNVEYLEEAAGEDGSKSPTGKTQINVNGLSLMLETERTVFVDKNKIGIETELNRDTFNTVFDTVK